ncbi:hypothetical protein BDD12DRAFT_174252 [Trichophaea hybrida]|nr:hypothetical protein BDD12DRAFT_174252 [Trichophaea hybrida]
MDSHTMGYYEMEIWALMMWSVKFAFMCLYWDMARHLPKYIRYTVYFTLGVLTVTFIGVLVMFTMWCRPVHLNWTLTESQLCTAYVSPFAVHAGSSAHLITELLVLLIPILIFRVVHVHRSKRIGVLFIFALGGVTLGISVISYGLRASTPMHAARVRKTGTFDQYVEEIRKRVENCRLASYTEASCAMLMLCLPSFRVLLRKFIDSRSPSDDTPERKAGLRRSNVLISFGSLRPR